MGVTKDWPLHPRVADEIISVAAWQNNAYDESIIIKMIEPGIPF
jgi:hypothetical protein